MTNLTNDRMILFEVDLFSDLTKFGNDNKIIYKKGS